MGRPYRMKGQKRKNKEEKYDKEEEENIEKLEGKETSKSPKRARLEDQGPDEEQSLQVADERPGIPTIPTDDSRKPGVIFILEKASLEIAKVGKSYQLLTSDDHHNYLTKNKRNPADYRPDIAHQAILAILDSRLNKAGRLKALYVRTEKGLLIEIKPHVRMPRTFKRFCGIMVQLLQKLHITAVGKGGKLLRVIKNPVTDYLPANSRKIGFSHSSGKLVSMQDYVGAIGDDTDLVFVVGAMAHGKIDNEYVDDYISVSEFPLSAAYCISIITNSVEQKWKIL